MKLKTENYYNLNQLKQIVDLKDRALKYRMNKVKVKYNNRKELLFKTGRNWNIHESIIFEFDRKKKSKKDDEFHNQSFVSVSPDGNYSKEVLVEVIKEIHNQLKHLREDIKIRYYIENGLKSNLPHLHFIVNLSNRYEYVIRRASKYYVKSNVDIRPVYIERRLISYLEKEVREKGVL